MSRFNLDTLLFTIIFDYYLLINGSPGNWGKKENEMEEYQTIWRTLFIIGAIGALILWVSTRFLRPPKE